MNSTLVLALLLAGPSVASNSSCPSARDIESHLSVLLPMQIAQPGTALVIGLPDRLLVDLRPEGPAAGAQQSVAVEDDCDQRARAAAIVIATWWPSEPGAQPGRENQAVARQLAKRDWLALSLGIFASAVSGSVAPGARVEVSARQRRLGFRVALGATASQGGSLGNGRVDWRRASGELGPTYGPGRLRVDAGLVASVFSMRGSNFAQNQGSTGITAGATAGLRVAWAFGAMLPWLELRGIWWPLSQRSYVVDADTGLQTSRAMPHAELQLAAGVAFSL
jgi:hypothetical protein